MGQQTRMFKIATIALATFGFGGKAVVPITRGMLMREMVLRLSSSTNGTGTGLTYGAAANNAGATLGRGDEWSVIQRIDVVANGGEIIRSFSGATLKMLNRLWLGCGPRISADMGSAGTATPSFDGTLVIPFWQPLCAKPMDTVLDTSKLADLRLEITVNSSADINSANGPTAISATLDVWGVQSFGITGDFTDCRLYQLFAQPSAANVAVQLQLPVGALYRGFFINCANGTGQVATDLPNTITNVALKSGPNTFRDVSWQMLRDWQRQRLGWGREQIQNAAANANVLGGYQKMGKSALLDEDAWAFMDLVQDGYLTEGIDTVGYSELFLEFNVSGACTIAVTPVLLYPPRGKAA